MSDDSFMQIVRERLAGHNFREAQGKDGLFYNKTIVAGNTFYIDMRRNPMRMYGYKQIQGDKDAALEDSYVDNVLQDMKRELVSIGCDLNQYVDNLPEKKKEKPVDTVPNNIETRLEIEWFEDLVKGAKEHFRDHGTSGAYEVILFTKQGNIQITIPRPEIKKSDQKTIDKGFF